MEQTITAHSIEPRPSDSNAGPSSVSSLSPWGQAWAAVLSQIATAFPGSEFARMGDEDLISTARAWEQTLSDVPLEAIPEIYNRVMRNCISDFAPSMGTFNATWKAWDYWAEANADPEAKAPAVPMLEAPISKELPRSMRLHRAWMAAGLPPICCKCAAPPAKGACWQCKQPEGKCTCRRRAELHQSGAFWVCGDSACGFDYSLDKMEADLEAHKGRATQYPPKAPKIAPRAASAPESAPEEPPQMSDAELVRRLVDQTGIELADQQRLTAFARFMYSEIRDTTLWSREIGKAQWRAFVERSKQGNDSHHVSR